MIVILLACVVIFILLQLVLFNPHHNSHKIVKQDINNLPTHLMIVAHPDDETLWGYNHLKNNPEEWKVICITCASDKIRGQEFVKVMDTLNIPNYEIWDHTDSIFAYYLNRNCVNDLENEMLKNKYKLIVTHNSHGEYGNLQHRAVHKSVSDICKKYKLPLMYFKPNKYKVSNSKDKILGVHNSQKYIIGALSWLHPFY